MAETIYKQLHDLICEIPAMTKDGRNPYHNSEYITYDSIVAKLRPLMQKHGIYISHRVDAGIIDGHHIRIAVTPIAANTAGETLEGGTMRCIVANNIQQIGAATTYLKRYTLAAFCAIAADPDDDGESLMKDHRQPAARPAAKVAPPRRLANGLATTTNDQARRINELVKAKKLARPAYDALQADTLGTVDTLDKLTRAQAAELIKALEGLPDPPAENN